MEAMKIYNHKQAYNKIHACLHTDVNQTRGMTENTLRDVIAILEDCGCEVCAPFKLGFQTALEMRLHHYHDAASSALTHACINIGTLLIPQNHVNN